MLSEEALNREHVTPVLANHDLESHLELTTQTPQETIYLQY